MLAVGAAICAGVLRDRRLRPTRILLPIALIAAIAMLISRSSRSRASAAPGRPAFAAFFVGLVGYTVAGRLRVPPLVVVVSAVVPMLPGLSIYRGLALMAEGGPATSQGLLAMVSAASVATALSSGVILGEYVAQPLKREAPPPGDRLAGPRLVGPPGGPLAGARPREGRRRADGPHSQSRLSPSRSLDF